MSVSIQQSDFGNLPDGQGVQLFTLSHSSGYEVAICNYGGIITGLKTPDRQGKLADIVLGFDTLAEYIEHNPYFGCITGRYANRIAAGRFELEGKIYQLSVNNSPNHLHGGFEGLDKVLWQAERLKNGVKFTHLSPDGTEGYPGNLELAVSYLLHEHELHIHYHATSDQTTIVNLTNHSYFNLGSDDTILSHELLLKCDSFNPVDANFIPTGVKAVEGSVFDFRDYVPIGQRIQADELQLKLAGGYDHNWIAPLNPSATPQLIASLREDKSGRQLDVLSTQPGVQFYSGNMLPELRGKSGQQYRKHAGLCLETQHFPNSPNEPSFPSVVLRAGERYDQHTIFRFSVYES